MFNFNVPLKKITTKAGETAQQLRVFAVFPVTHMAGHSCNTSSRGSNTFFWPQQAPGIQVVDKYRCGQRTLTHEKKIFNYYKQDKLQLIMGNKQQVQQDLKRQRKQNTIKLRTTSHFRLVQL